MNKNEFINYIENRLSILKKEERDDIINEYIQHIDNKLAEGLSEKDAVATLGDPEDLVRDILQAYNVDPDYGNKEEENEINSFINSIFSQLKNALKSIGDYVVSQRFSALIGLFIKAIVLVFALMICFVIGRGVLMIICNILGGWYILRTVVSFAYTIIGIPVMIYVFIRFLDYTIHKNSVKTAENINTDNEVKPQGKTTVRNTVTSKRNDDYSFYNIIKKLIIFAVRICVLFCLIPAVFVLIFTVIGFGGLVIMTFAGYPFAGLTIGALGFNMAGIGIMALIIKLVYFNKGAVK